MHRRIALAIVLLACAVAATMYRTKPSNVHGGVRPIGWYVGYEVSRSGALDATIVVNTVSPMERVVVTWTFPGEPPWHWSQRGRLGTTIIMLRRSVPVAKQGRMSLLVWVRGRDQPYKLEGVTPVL